MTGHAHQAKARTSPSATQSGSGGRSTLNLACGCKKVPYKCKGCEKAYRFSESPCRVADDRGAAAGGKLCTPFEASQKTKNYCPECKDKGMGSFVGKLKKTFGSTKWK
jgi:hypothetical protein